MSITTEEQRRQLEAQGWDCIVGDDGREKWHLEAQRLNLKILACPDRPRVEFRPANGYTNTDDLNALVAALSILQIPIPGYRIIREEGEATP